MSRLVINFVTTNVHKFAVAQHFFETAGLDIDLRQYDIETPEIQADTVDQVALNSAKWVAEKLNQPVVVADAGLYIEGLNGFPGPYIKYINSTLSLEDILAMMAGKKSRRAEFVDALAYYDPATQTEQVFSSGTLGRIVSEPATSDGSATDRIFAIEGFYVPLADMSEADRKKAWNTRRWQELIDFLAEVTRGPAVR
jgi:XTP/dITP diphosphohydrolase